MRFLETDVERRRVLGWLAGPATAGVLLGPAACAQAPRTYVFNVHRDAGCGCCLGWAEIMRQSGRFEVAVTSEADMTAVKQRLGVPAALASCHTGVVDGYVIEGHVPAADILNLLATRPQDVIGLAVPGMPRGSPGMETPDGTVDPYEVHAFNAKGEAAVFARHGGAG